MCRLSGMIKRSLVPKDVEVRWNAKSLLSAQRCGGYVDCKNVPSCPKMCMLSGIVNLSLMSKDV